MIIKISNIELDDWKEVIGITARTTSDTYEAFAGVGIWNQLFSDGRRVVFMGGLDHLNVLFEEPCNVESENLKQIIDNFLIRISKLQAFT